MRKGLQLFCEECSGAQALVEQGGAWAHESNSHRAGREMPQLCAWAGNKLLTVAQKAWGTLTGEKIHLKAALKFARFVSLALD